MCPNCLIQRAITQQPGHTPRRGIWVAELWLLGGVCVAAGCGWLCNDKGCSASAGPRRAVHTCHMHKTCLQRACPQCTLTHSRGVSLTRYVLKRAREGRLPASVTTRQHTLNQVTHRSVVYGLLRCGGLMAYVWPHGLGGVATTRDAQRRMGLGVPHRHWTTRVCHRAGGSTLQYASGSGSG